MKYIKDSILGILIFSLFLALLPGLRLLPLVGKQAFFGAYTTSYSSYLTRIHEIKDGHPFIGNPYFFEHRDELAQSFFVADWLAAIPLLLGLPFGFAMSINLFFWLSIFSFLTFLLLRMAGVDPKLGILGLIVGMSTSYLFLIIPVSMQIVTPFYILFLLALSLWLKNPLNNRNSIFLVIASAAPFYIYTYLWQITFATMLAALAVKCLERSWPEVKRLGLILLGALLLAGPQILYTIRQLQHPDYWDTVTRIGFVATHIPTSRAIIFASWVLCIVVFAIYKRHVFVIVTSFALAAVSLSNVITGKELELGQHIPRFIVYWVPVALAMLLSSLPRTKKNLIALMLLALPLIIVIPKDYQSFFTGTLAQGAKTEIEYHNKLSGVLNWLQTNEPEPIVVAVLPRITQIEEAIPTFTRHYVLFASTGIVHLLSTNETLERYLITQILKPKNKQELWDYREEFAGIGNSTHFNTAQRRRQLVCQYLHVCEPQPTHPLTPEFFRNAYVLEQQIIANPKPYFQKYRVKYILLNTGPIPPVLSSLNLTPAYSDPNFTLYKMPY